MRLYVGIAIGLLLGISVVLLSSHGGPQAVHANSPSGNGDVNGSGAVDIADAIYLLTYLFAQGPAPEAIESPPCDSCCSPCPTVTSIGTGQTTCFDGAGQAIPCDSQNGRGQDGFYHFGCPMDGRFTDNGDGTVSDSCTGLMWLKATADVNGDGVGDIDDWCTWYGALNFSENLVFATYDDWRLPNIRELLSIVDYARILPAIDPVFDLLPRGYWSSTRWLEYGGSVGWGVNFERGWCDYPGNETYAAHVIAVRTIMPRP